MDQRDIWSNDTRQIVAAKLNGHPYGNEGIFLKADAFAFERFERSGEMASIPYLRIVFRDGRHCVEAPLRHFAWVEFEEQSNA